MGFSWDELIDLASELAASKVGRISKEARLRSSINRAYFGAHKTAADWLSGSVKVPKQGSAHGFVITSLKRSRKPATKKAGIQLDSLRAKRAKVDYSFRSPIASRANALASIADARDICNAVKKESTP